ncbi:MAG TPA: MgtC/SapB family protein [Actinomycetota bacterium]
MDVEVQLALFGRAALAALLGFVIGLEREYRGKAAGDRTFALLAFAAAAITATGVEVFGLEGTSRVIQGVVAGVGFLGAGLIIRGSQTHVRGLTTAASSWAVTGVAILVGVGAYLTAALGTVLVLLILEFDAIPALRRIRDLAESGGADRDDEP